MRRPFSMSFTRSTTFILKSRQWFEKEFLKSTDDLASQALARILAGQMHTLDDLRKSGWTRFLMTLRFRHPDLVSEMRDKIAILWRNHDVFTKGEYERTRSADDPETFDGYIAQLAPDAHIRVQLDLLVAGMDNEQIGRHNRCVDRVASSSDLRLAGRTEPRSKAPYCFAASEHHASVRRVR